jgi:hypothetical protein
MRTAGTLHYAGETRQNRTIARDPNGRCVSAAFADGGGFGAFACDARTGKVPTCRPTHTAAEPRYARKMPFRGSREIRTIRSLQPSTYSTDENESFRLRRPATTDRKHNRRSRLRSILRVAYPAHRRRGTWVERPTGKEAKRLLSDRTPSAAGAAPPRGPSTQHRKTSEINQCRGLSTCHLRIGYRQFAASATPTCRTRQRPTIGVVRRDIDPLQGLTTRRPQHRLESGLKQ